MKALGLVFLYFFSVSVALAQEQDLGSRRLLDNYLWSQKERKKEELKTTDFVPTSLRPRSGVDSVVGAIADKSLLRVAPENFNFSSSSIPQKFGLSKKHQVNLRFQAYDGMAQLNYSGLADLKMIYRSATQTTAVEMHQQFPQARRLVLSHELRPDQRVSTINLRWDL